MISYGRHPSRKPIYLNREMTEGARATQSVHVDGAVELNEKSELLPPATSAVGETLRWAELCQRLRSEFLGSDVELFTVSQDAHLVYTSKPIGLRPIQITREAQTRLGASKTVVFLPELPHSSSSENSMNGDIRSFVASLDFGIDGQYVIRISRPIGSSVFSNDDLQKFHRCATFLEHEAQTTKRVLISAVNAYGAALQYANRPFALIDDSLQILQSNEHFQVVSTAYFKFAAGALIPSNSFETKRIREAIRDTLSGHSKIEISLRRENQSCVAVLHEVRLAHLRVSNRSLIGLELKGALPPAMVDSKLLAELFSLTRREADVAALLSSGKSVTSIAKLHDVSVGTVRVQLKAIFRKTGVAGQVELISKVLAFPF
jgi:DNA-binding CsgD family transcriptional regulator